METLDCLQFCHRRAPFLFFNGNTFAEIGRALSNAVFSDVHFSRKKEISSAVAHYITGVFSREDMASIVDSLWQSTSFAPGDRVTTLRGSLSGEVIAILDDGRIKWCSNSGTALLALPESLIRDG